MITEGMINPGKREEIMLQFCLTKSQASLLDNFVDKLADIVPRTKVKSCGLTNG
jgi:hypothetical protein